jgi:hypothetical protein
MVYMARLLGTLLALFFATGHALAQFREQDAVPFTIAVVEMCEQQLPRWKQGNTTAFMEWQGRNQNGVARVEKNPHFRRDMDALKNDLTGSMTIPDWTEFCSRVSQALRNPKFKDAP